MKNAIENSGRKMKIVNVFDSKAEGFSPTPMFFETIGIAERAIEKAVVMPDHPFSQNPADYTFFETGVYDIETGDIKMHESKVALGTALQFKARVLREQKKGK